MFEDSLMESAHKIKARSKYWSILALFLNTGILLTLIVLPLLHPEALPKQMMAALMVAPPTPASPPAMPKAHVKSEMVNSTELLAPGRIPKIIKPVQEAAMPPSMERVVEGLNNSTPGGINSVIGSTGTAPIVVVKAPPKKVLLTSVLMAGNLLEKTLPQYPAIARATRTQGTVVLQATISKAGLIENLRVISGPPLLQQAAMDAVRSWRYKPYLLNGEPVEVETTVNVVFNLGE